VTALLHASRGGNLEIVNALLRAGAKGWIADVRLVCIVLYRCSPMALCGCVVGCVEDFASRVACVLYTEKT